MKTEKRKLKHNLELALEKLEKEDQQILKQFDKLENRNNTFLSISLGIFSLQITLLTNTIINIYEYLLSKHYFFATSILILFILNTSFNMNSISNFRKSSKISEKIYSNIYNINEFNKHNYKEIYLLKEEIIAYQDNISDYKTKIKHKTKYINRGLNNIILSMAIIIILIITLFLLIGNVI